MTLSKRLILSLLIMIFAASCAFAQMARLYNSEYGLQNSQINQVYQDSRGFIWVSTENGLARFDGMDFETFHCNGGAEGLSSNLVLCTLEDSERTFWVGTSMGLQTFDNSTGMFTKVNLNDSSVPSSTQHVTSIAEVRRRLSEDPEIWVAGSQHGVYPIDIETHEVIYEKRNVLLKNIPNTFISKIFQDSRGMVWLASEVGGLTIVRTDGTRVGDFDRITECVPEGILVTDFAEDPQSGDVLIATQNSGLLIYRSIAGKIEASADQSTKRYVIMSLLHNRLNNSFGNRSFVVGTENNGMLFYDMARDELSGLTFQNIPFRTTSWKVHSLMEDNQGNIWVGAYQSGIMVIPKSMYGFEYTSFARDGRSATNNPCVTSILQDPADNSLWIAADGGGLLHLHENGRREYFNASNSGLKSNSIQSISMDRHGAIWIATFGAGLFRMGPDRVIRQFKEQDKLGTEKIMALCYDGRKDRILAGTNGNGLSVISTTDEIIKLTLSEDVNKWISSLFIDSKGMLWVGTYNGPLSYDSETRQLVTYNVNLLGMRTRVYSFCEGDPGIIWIGTGEGLVEFNRTKNTTKLYTEEEGLSSNVVTGILRGNDGILWISTSNGLSRLDPGKGEFKRYYSYDGLQGDEFHYRATFGAEDGTLFFGGVNGVTYFKPESIRQKEHPIPDLYLTRLRVLDSVVEYDSTKTRNILDNHIEYAQKIVLKNRENTFSLDFTVPEYTNPMKIVFAYRMDKYDPVWHNTLSNVRTASYTNLPSGRYNLTIRAYLDGNEENSTTRTISVRILPPWYQSWWADILYFLILGGIILYSVLTYRMKKKHDAEIEESNIKEMKLQMFTNLSHEIRTPLTLVMSPLKQFRETETDPQKKEIYNLMYRNTLRINRMVSQLMDIRKIDNGQMKLHFLETDVVYFIKDIMKSFDNLAESRSIDFNIIPEERAVNLWIDQGNFDKIIFNILSNAFKYTPEGGMITVRVTDGLANDGRLGPEIKTMTIIDIFNSGSHVEEESLGKIFDRFFQTDVMDAKVGSGVGLNLAKMLVELHHGKIDASNNDGGVTFSICIPEGNRHLTEAEMSRTSHHKDLYTKSINPEDIHSATDRDLVVPDIPGKDNTRPEQTMQENRGDRRLLERVKEAIADNLDNPDFGVEDLSREVGMSRVHINRRLKDAANISPSFLIKSIRLKKSADLLINGGVSISEVASRVGFSTHSYFSSSFRDYFGMTPKEFVARYADHPEDEFLKKLLEQ